MDIRNRIARRAAAYFQPGDVVNLGIGIPSLCNIYAPEGVMIHTENGLIGIGPRAEGDRIYDSFHNANAQPFIPVSGASTFDSSESFSLVRSGKLAATVLGALQVSGHGDLANWARPGYMVGMGGAMDLVNGARQVIVTMELTAKNGAKKILNECSFPLTGARCVSHIVTEKCVLDVTSDGLVLRELLDGVSAGDIQAQVEPTLIIPGKIGVLEA